MPEITREEFDRRLDAANAQKTLQLDALDAQREQVERLLSHYEAELDLVENQLGAEPSSVMLRERLRALSEQTARVAALL